MASIQSPTDHMQVAARLRLAVTRLGRRLRQQAESGLTASTQSALATIARHGPLSLGELAAHEGVRPPSISTTVASLESQGMVARDLDATDRRVSRVWVTPRGRLRLQRDRSRKTAYLAARLARLDQHDLRLLDEAAAVMERLLEEDR